jgi:hypothetical protein
MDSHLTLILLILHVVLRVLRLSTVVLTRSVWYSEVPSKHVNPYIYRVHLNQLIPWFSLILETLTVVQVGKKFITVFTKALH